MIPAHLHEIPRADEFLKLLDERVPERLKQHCVSVTETLLRVGEELELDPEACAAAGLLHDHCKPLSASDMLQKASEYEISISEMARSRPKFLHGPVAAAEAWHRLGVHDEAVYEAIYWHTTGKPGLGPLGLGLYFADFAEPLRSHPESAEARTILEQNGFEAALKYVSEMKLAHIRTKDVVDPMSEAFHEWLLEAWV